VSRQTGSRRCWSAITAAPLFGSLLLSSGKTQVKDLTSA
jgi:hypothetical protein